MKKSIFFDEEAQQQIEALDKKMNLKSNYSAVVRLAIQRLYEEEMKQNDGSFRSRTNGTD